jgi:hypothetical protein
MRRPLPRSALFIVCLLFPWPSQAQPTYLSPHEWPIHGALEIDPPPASSPVQLLPLSYPVRSGPADRWWALDKAKHVTFSFLWTLSAQYVLVDKAGWSDGTALPVAAGSGAAVGLSKEWFDWRYGPTRRFSSRDLVADAAGILLAVGVIAL